MSPRAARGRRPCRSSRSATGRPRSGRQRIAEAEVAPAQVGREQHAAGLGFDHARHHDPDALTPAQVAMLRENRLDALRPGRDELARIPFGRKAGDARQLTPDQVGDHDEGPGRPDVDGDDAALPRVDIEKGRLAPALGLAGGALEHGAFPNQRAHQRAHGAAPDAHQPREVGAGDGLVGPDEVQRDPAVDRPSGAPGGNAHGSARGSAHLSLGRPIYPSTAGHRQVFSPPSRRPRAHFRRDATPATAA